MAARLPDELIVQILSTLPAKSLLRCRSVCKSWLNLISSTRFKLMHLHNFNQLNPRYLVRRFDWILAHEWYNVHFDDEVFTLDRSAQIGFPFDRSGAIHWFRIVGCCNGVVCLCDKEGCTDMVILWNPSIRRMLALPLPRFYSVPFEDSFVVLGFGYDKTSDDFKLVCMAYTVSQFTRPHVEVYAVKTGIWREVMFPDDLRSYFVFYAWPQLFFNGVVHWIACDWSLGPLHNAIMTFDTSTDVFGEISLPDELVKGQLSLMMVSLVGESLAVTYYNGLASRTRMDSSTYKVWVMKEYKNPTSWTLMYNMHYPDRDMGKPLKLRNNGDMIMESRDGNMVIHNYSGCVACICTGYESEEMDCMTYVDKYQESLDLLDVGYSVSDAETDEGSDQESLASSDVGHSVSDAETDEGSDDD